jgi:PH (Pleckstrin Homology) domain-containing protein
MSVIRSRPIRLRRLCVGLAASIVVVFAFIALVLRRMGTGASFGLADQVSIFGIGVAVAAGILVLARPTLEADEHELRIRNVIGRHVLPWTSVRAVLFRDNRPWAALELHDDEEVPLMAVQAADGQRTVAVVRALREMLAESRSESRSG